MHDSIHVIASGSDTHANELHPSNASYSILFTLFGIFMLVSDSHPAKAPVPILVTLLGITTFENETQPWNK